MEDKCTICGQPMTYGLDMYEEMAIYQTPCGRHHHWGCAYNWIIITDGNCPCRGEVLTPEDLVYAATPRVRPTPPVGPTPPVRPTPSVRPTPPGPPTPPPHHQRIGQVISGNEIEELCKQGTHLPPNMVGLTDEQLEELKLVDEWGEKCVPSGGWRETKGTMGKRNGKQPLENMCAVLEKTVNEVQEGISKKLVDQGKTLTKKDVLEQLDLLRGATMIVYPMGLPPHEPIRIEFEFREELGGTHDSLQVIAREEAEMWFCGKQIFTGGGQLLGDFIGRNENETKVVVKLQKRGSGPPAREPLMTEEEQKALMMYAYRRQQEQKKLEEDDDDDHHLNSEWVDGKLLKQQFQDTDQQYIPAYDTDSNALPVAAPAPQEENDVPVAEQPSYDEDPQAAPLSPAEEAIVQGAAVIIAQELAADTAEILEEDIALALETGGGEPEPVERTMVEEKRDHGATSGSNANTLSKLIIPVISIIFLELY